MKTIEQKAKKVPAIRFAGFDDEWVEKKLGDVAVSFGYGLNAAAKPYDGTNKYLRITDIDDSSRDFKKDDLTTPDFDLVKANDYRLDEGDLLFARTGASVGKTFIYKKSDGLVYFAGFLIRAKIKSEYDSKFIFQNTLTNPYDKFVKITSQRSGQPGINAQEYADYSLLMPKLNEQQKLGSFFSNIDSLISLEQKKYDKLTQVKKSMLEKMFPKEGATVPEIRFADFTGDWKIQKLGSIGTVIDPHPSHRAPKEEIGGIPFIGIGDVDAMGNINHESARPVSPLVYEDHHKRYDLSIPSLGLARVASLGKVIKLRADVGKYAVSPTMSVIQFNKTVDVNYVYSFMNTPLFQKQFEGKSNGSTRQSVGTEIVRILDVNVPPTKTEQQKIGSYFSHLDSLISLQQRKLEKLKNIKKSLLEKMFV